MLVCVFWSLIFNWPFPYASLCRRVQEKMAGRTSAWHGTSAWLRVGLGPVIPTVGAGDGEQVLAAFEVEGGLDAVADSGAFRCVGDLLFALGVLSLPGELGGGVEGFFQGGLRDELAGLR